MSCNNTNLITQIVSEGVTHYTACYKVENRKKMPKLHKNTQVLGLIFDVFWPKISIFEAFFCKTLIFLKVLPPKKSTEISVGKLSHDRPILKNSQVFEANYRVSLAKMNIRVL
jgi:hypothetical protein